MTASGESLEERLRVIAEIDAKIEAITAYKLKKEAIEEKKEAIEKLKSELETQTAIVAAVDPDLLDMMSRSASAKERIAEINQAVEEAVEELEMWEQELNKLEEDLDTVSLDDLESLQEERRRLDQQ